MNETEVNDIARNLSQRPSDELRTIYIGNDTQTWRPEAFRAIARILVERGEALPDKNPVPPELPPHKENLPMHNNSRTKFYLALVVVAIPFTFFWMNLIREVVAENQTILANSTVAEAVVTSTTQSRSRRTETSFWVKYRYNVDGITYEGSSPIDSASVKKAEATGRVAILYEIEHPSQSHLRDSVEMMSFIPSTHHLVMIAYVLALTQSICLNGAYVWLTKRFPQLPNPYRNRVKK